jgi:hypothetical protein
MENAVPARLVDTQPKSIANNKPANPPTNGITGSGMGNLPAAITFKAWAVMKPPMP